jgi:hypothetical protein
MNISEPLFHQHFDAAIQCPALTGPIIRDGLRRGAAFRAHARLRHAVSDEQLRDGFGVLGDFIGDTEQEPGTLAGSQVGPLPLRSLSALDGTVDYCVEALQDYRDRLRFDSFVFWPNSSRPEQTRLFLEQVRPRLEPVGSHAPDGHGPGR